MNTPSNYIYNTDFYQAIRKNKRNSIILICCMFVILFCLGYLMGLFTELQLADNQNYSQYNNYPYHQSYNTLAKNQNTNPFSQISETGLMFASIAILIGFIWALIAIFSGPKIILTNANAYELLPSDKDYQKLLNVVQEISIAAGTPQPKVYIIETPELNAFATGMSPNNAIVAITRGLLENLERDELQGVMAHEIGHVINYDIRYQTLVSIIVGLIVLISDIARRMVFVKNTSRQSKNNNNSAAIIGLILIVFSILAPIAAIILQLAVSRQREYLADATSVKLTRNPIGLIKALAKLAEHSKPFPGASKANQNLFIVNPFKSAMSRKSSIFATHPPLAERIARLKNLSS